MRYSRPWYGRTQTFAMSRITIPATNGETPSAGAAGNRDHEQHHGRAGREDDAARERDDPEDHDDHERVAQAGGEADQPVGDPAIEADRPAHVPEALERAEKEQERPIDRCAEPLAIQRARHEHREREE